MACARDTSELCICFVPQQRLCMGSCFFVFTSAARPCSLGICFSPPSLRLAFIHGSPPPVPLPLQCMPHTSSRAVGASSSPFATRPKHCHASPPYVAYTCALGVQGSFLLHRMSTAGARHARSLPVCSHRLLPHTYYRTSYMYDMWAMSSHTPCARRLCIWHHHLMEIML